MCAILNGDVWRFYNQVSLIFKIEKKIMEILNSIFKTVCITKISVCLQERQVWCLLYLQI